MPVLCIVFGEGFFLVCHFVIDLWYALSFKDSGRRSCCAQISGQNSHNHNKEHKNMDQNYRRKNMRWSGYGRTFMAFILGLALLPAAVYADAEKDRTERMQQRFEANFERMSERLSLTDEQYRDIRSLANEYREKRMAIYQQMRPVRMELRGLRSAEQPDRDAIKAKLEELQEHRTELHMISLDYREAVEALLDDEQKALWRAYREERSERYRQLIRDRSEGRGQRGQPGPGEGGRGR